MKICIIKRSRLKPGLAKPSKKRTLVQLEKSSKQRTKDQLILRASAASRSDKAESLTR